MFREQARLSCRLTFRMWGNYALCARALYFVTTPDGTDGSISNPTESTIRKAGALTTFLSVRRIS